MSDFIDYVREWIEDNPLTIELVVLLLKVVALTALAVWVWS